MNVSLICNQFVAIALSIKNEHAHVILIVVLHTLDNNGIEIL